MCKGLKEIHDLQASDILHKYSLPKTTSKHIDVFEILDHLNLTYESISFEELEKSLFLKGNDTILGMAYSKGDKVGILYSNTLCSKDINYVVAHELAHCCLHLPVSAEFHVELKTKNDIYSSFLSKPLKNSQVLKKEKEADMFAADLLIPTEMLVSYIKNSDSLSIEDISNHFNVPELLVHKKIIMLSKRI